MYLTYNYFLIATRMVQFGINMIIIGSKLILQWI